MTSRSASSTTTRIPTGEVMNANRNGHHNGRLDEAALTRLASEFFTALPDDPALPGASALPGAPAVAGAPALPGDPAMAGRPAVAGDPAAPGRPAPGTGPADGVAGPADPP